jgi:NADH oxidase (H2O2-forming)
VEQLPRKIVIIGCGAAGVSAASAARKTDRSAEITMLNDEKYAAYSRCGIPYVIEGEIPTFDSLVIYPPQYYNMMKINLHTETTVTDIDPKSKTVKAMRKGGKEQNFNYDSLIIATGAGALVIPVPGSNLPGVYAVRTLDDGKKILEASRGAKSAVVIGARLVGLETAVALRKHGLDVTVIELLTQILDGILDPELAKEIQTKLEGAGIHFILGVGISEIVGKNHVEAAHAGPYKVKADFVVMATGVRARTDLAKKMGLTIGETKLIKADEHMETNIRGVYAAGDCVECVSAITGKPTVSQLGTNAVRQGKVAGVNAAGGSMVYPRILCSCITRILGTEIASTGVTETYAKKQGIECISATAEADARPPYYPKKVPVRVKLVANPDDGKLVGAQIISIKEAGPRIDTISAAIMKGATVEDLILYDHAYCPPVADVVEPLSVVAELVARRLIRKR